MKFENILQMICSAPAILLDIIVQGFKSFFIQEKELLQQEEIDEDDVITEQMEREQTPVS